MYPAVLIRATPGVEAHTHGVVRTGQVDSKFGFGVASGDAARAVARAQDSPAVDLVGVHMHIGSQVFVARSEEHTSELQSLMRISYAVFCLKKKKKPQKVTTHREANHTQAIDRS